MCGISCHFGIGPFYWRRWPHPHFIFPWMRCYPTAEEELSYLKRYKDELQRELSKVSKRIEELEKG